MSEWTETKAVLSEVEQLFNRDDDIRYIFDVKKMAKEIDSHCSSYLLETKEIIKSELQLLLSTMEHQFTGSLLLFFLGIL